MAAKDAAQTRRQLALVEIYNYRSRGKPLGSVP